MTAHVFELPTDRPSWLDPFPSSEVLRHFRITGFSGSFYVIGRLHGNGCYIACISTDSVLQVFPREAQKSFVFPSKASAENAVPGMIRQLVFTLPSPEEFEAWKGRNLVSESILRQLGGPSAI